MRTLLACLLFLAAASSFAQPEVRLSVIVSIPPQKYMLERIGGKRISVQVMLPPGAVPETYEPSPRQIAALSDAQLYFRIGVPFERLSRPALDSARSRVRVIDSNEDEVPGQAKHELLDPHVWMSPAAFMRVAARVRDELVATDPEYREYFEQNYHLLRVDIESLQRSIMDRLSNRRIDDFIVGHAALGHFAKEFGLNQIALEDGDKEAGPRGIARIIAIARKLEIRTVFIQPRMRSNAARVVAREAGAQLVEIDPLAEDYPMNLMQIAESLAEAMH